VPVDLQTFKKCVAIIVSVTTHILLVSIPDPPGPEGTKVMARSMTPELLCAFFLYMYVNF